MPENIDQLQIEISANVDKADKALNNLSKTLLKLNESLGNIDASGIENIKKGSEGISLDDRVLQNYQELSRTLESISKIDFSNLQKIQKSQEKTAQSSHNLAEAFKDVRSNLDFSSMSFSDLERGLSKAQARLEKYGDAEEKALLTGRDTGRSWENIQYQIAKALNDVIGFENALERIGRLSDDIRIHGLDTETESYEESPRIDTVSADSMEYDPSAMEAVFGSAYKDINNWNEAVEKFGNNVRNTLGKAGIDVDDFEEKLEGLQAPEIDETDLKKLQSELDKTEKKINRLLNKQDNDIHMGVDTDSKPFRNLQRQIIETSKYADALKAKIASIGKESGQVSSPVLPDKVPKITPDKLFKGISKAFNGLFGTFKKLGDGIESMIKKISRASKEIKKSSGRNGDFGIGQMLGTSLLFSTVFQAIGAVQSAIKEGSDNLTQYSDSYNKNISAIVSALKTLRNAFAVAFAPILDVVAPYLVTFINLVTKALNAVARFWAALTGKTSAVQATGVNEDYAASLEDVSNAAKDAQKNINNLLGIDELNVISPQEGISGGGGGGEAASPGDGFITVPIEDSMLAFADKMADILGNIFAPLKAAWETEGKNVIEAWKYALGEVLSLVHDIGRDFLKVWNEDATIKILTDILAIIADIGLTIGNLAKNFRLAWNENEVGLNILRNIRDIIGAIISNIREAADATVIWSAQLDFSPLLNAFERFTSSLVPAVDAVSGIFTDFYQQVLLPLGKWTLEEGLPDLLGVLTDFVEKVDWASLRENFSELWTSLEPFAETVGEGLILFLENVSDLVANFLNSEELENFLDHLADWMDSVEPEDIATGIRNLAVAFVGFKIALAGLDAVIAGSKVLTFLADAKTLFGDTKTTADSGSKSMKNFGGAIGIAQSGIIGMGAGIGIMQEINNILENLFGVDKVENAEDFAKKFNQLTQQYKDGKISLSDYKAELSNLATEAENAGIALDEKVTQKLENVDWLPSGERAGKDFTKGVTKSLDEEQEPIRAKADTIGSVMGEGIQTGSRIAAVGAITTISTVFEQRWGEITSWFSLEKWETVFGNIKTAFETKWNELVTWWDESGIGLWWNEHIAPWFTLEKWMELFNNIWLGLQTKWSELVAWWDELGIGAWWNEHIAPWFTLEKWLTLYASIKDSLIKKWNEAVTWWKTNIQLWWTKNVEPWFTLERWQKLGEAMKEGIYAGFKGLANKAVDVLNQVISSIESMINSAIDGINSLLDMINGSGLGEFFDLNLSLGNISFGRIPHFAEGGFPSMGELFVAREAGPEFVGSIGSRSAVANNDQIVSGIAAGVREAIVEVLTPYLDDLTATNREIADKDTSIQLDGRELVAGIDQRRARNGFSFT